MTELLSREKEFLKMNEELDKIAAETVKESPKPTSTMRSNEMRFNTYTKPKVLIKRRGGGGDGPLKASGIAETTAVTPKNAISPRSQPGGIAKPPQIPHTILTSAMVAVRITDTNPAYQTQNTNNNNNNNNNRTDKSIEVETAQAAITAPQPEYAYAMSTTPRARGSRAPDNLSRNGIKRPNNRVSHNQTFTVRYRNPNFINSPSLDVLAKQESAALCLSHEDESSEFAAQNLLAVLESDVRQPKLDNSSRKQLTTDGLIKFLKTKIAILEEDHERLTQEMTNQKDVLEKMQERNKIVEQQRDLAYSRNNTLSEQLQKVDAQLEEANRRFRERSLEQSQQQKELEVTKRELKIMSQSNVSLEKRLFRANEDLENAKSTLKDIKSSERELQHTKRTESENKDKQIKSLKKQRADLLNAYKKQLFLIDNLKRQNTCLEQSRMSFISEKEFTKVLEWNSKA